MRQLDKERGSTSSSRDDRPLDDASFAGLMLPFEPFEPRPHLAVALSGGADSLALCLLAARWAARRDGRVLGITVDHRLRPESMHESQQTGLWLAAVGIEHLILPWFDARPGPGLQRRARDARYTLLEEACVERGILHLLLGHHQDDQAETVIMRRARRSGLRGLAAMPSQRERPALRLVRPLLDMPKQRLVRTLCGWRQPWITDPSNVAPIFTRSRLRQEPIDARAQTAKVAGFAVRRQEAEMASAAWFAAHAHIDPAGFVRLNRGGFERTAVKMAIRLVGQAIATVAGAIYQPRSAALWRLVEAMAQGGRSSWTLGGCRIVAVRDGWLICREAAAIDQVLAIRAGLWQFWDDRFAICASARWNGLEIRALNEDGWARRERLGKPPERTLRAVIGCSLPAIWQGDRLVAIPHLGISLFPDGLKDLRLRFRPRLPLADAPFCAHMSNLDRQGDVAP